ncbi:MAG: energy-coupling factor transporter transmembrane protein EcfT [Muribaculaceae bacterium]|nr:energy-coupling factor transporter transmembrane protein EcfT [Muribaculaceae bacterium]
MSKIDSALATLHALDRGEAQSCPSYASGAATSLLVTLVYLAVMLSVPLQQLSRIVWMAAYPIVWSSLAGVGYGSLLVQSLYALPFIVFVGIFNPIFDTAEAFTAGGIVVSRGWVSFVSILLRGMLSVQAVLLLLRVCGFSRICRTLRRWHVPAVFVAQLMLVYRYLGVLLDELRTMSRARIARGYGSKHLSLQLWGTMAGQLFLRSVERAGRVHRAMLARGFDGTMPCYDGADAPGAAAGSGRWIWVAAWTAVFAVLRFAPLDSMFHFNNIAS